ncbi:Uncharacterised protein [Zhongshania aliphaticivorans]|uniref:Uncharacterized protein n=1 Tax=Zhongshania aliphaticivorans TaxID=1470434 RepID=A0A5S9P718_9GAMM|nr:hypothetical protein [Zhongshania aliphaticivorans]CAA0091828.1 Uncharacterised protein [Zhongshania aliphaticivorans]CAA0099166.1 Uncharacterised protein [Zhongshania aliphaticivorans]
MQRLTKLSTTITFITLLNACGGGSGGGGDEPALTALSPLGSEASCPDLQFDTLAADVGTTIFVNGLPSSMTAPGLRIIDAQDSEIVTPAFFRVREGDEDWQFELPMHPNTPAEGGQVLIEIGDGSNHCPQQTFTINALPTAPADYAQDVQAALVSWVEAAARHLGLDPAQLRAAEESELTGMAAVMRLALDTADDPNAPGSIKALADEAAADSDMLLERFLMALDIEERLLDDTLFLDQSEPAVQSIAHNDSGSKGQQIIRKEEQRVYRNTGSCGGGLQFPGATKPNIKNIFDLASAMKSAKNRTIKNVTSHSATATNYAGTANWSKATGVGNILFIVSTVDEALNAALPQVFSQFIVTGDSQIVEDREATNPAAWQSKIAAKGIDFNLEKAAAQTIIQGLGLIPGPVGTALSTATFAYGNEVNAEIDRVTKDSCFKVEAPEYGPFDATYENYTAGKLIGSTISLVGHHQYMPSDIGLSEIEVKIIGETFGTSSNAKKTLPVNVNSQVLSLLPSTTRIAEAGEEVEISATISNSEADPANFDVEVVGGVSRGEVTNLRVEGDFLTATIVPTSDREKYPVQVRFTSLNTTLPAGSPPHDKLADIEIELDVKLTPDDTPCLEAGDEVPLIAELTGFDEDEQEVDFSATGGSFKNETDLTATWVAPQANGEYVITATATYDANEKDESRFTVADNCIRKIWYPVGGFSIDNNGTYSDEGQLCPQESIADDQTESFDEPIIPEVPQLPAESEFWDVHTESKTWGYTHNSMRHIVDDKDNNNGSDDSCSSISLSGLMDADVTYEGRADGTLAASVDARLETNCERYSNGDIECASGGGGIGFGGFIYQDITKQTTVTLSGSLSCTGLEGNIGTGLAPLSIVAIRYENGTTPYNYEEEGNTSIKDKQGNYRSPQLFSASCKPEQGDTVTPFEVEFVLDAPTGNGNTDLIIYGIAGSVLIAPDSSLSVNAFPGTPPTEPVPGSYLSEGKVELEVKIE